MPLDRSNVDFNIVRRRFKQNINMQNAEKYRFYGQYFPQLDEFIFKRYFPDVNIQGVFVECGANDGLAGSNCKFFEETMHWAGYNIEPSPSTFKILKKNRPDSANICAALSNFRGKLPFAITESIETNVKYRGAVNRVIERENKTGDIFSVSGTKYKITEIIEVPCMTWCDFVAEYDIQRVDLFILDTEGHEFAVLTGMQGCPILPSVICVEGGWREEIRQKLEEFGYLYDITHFGNHMYIKKDLAALFALRWIHKNY